MFVKLSALIAAAVLSFAPAKSAVQAPDGWLV